jgi:CHAT domain-containing protein/tetratricopeptide (TPR) repeat protein
MHRKVLLSLMLCFAMFVAAHAQSNELIQGVTELMTKYQSGQLEEMLALSERMAALAEKEFGPQDSDYALILFFVGVAQADQGKFSQAQATLDKSMGILKNAKNPMPQQVSYPGYLMLAYGKLYNQIGNYLKAEENLLNAAKFFEQKTGKDAVYALPINDLGNYYKDQGDYAKAEKYLYEASEIRRRTLGEKHFNYGVSLNNLASLYEQMGNYRAAALYYEDSYNIWKVSLGEYHPLIATAFNNYAGLQVKVGNYDAAEKLFLNALEVGKKAYGTEKHEKYASSLSNLGNLYRSMKQFDKAEQAATKCLQLRKEIFGTDHIDYAYSLNNLGLIQMDKGNLQESEKNLLQALATFKTKLGKNHRNVATCSNNLGFVYFKLGNAEKAATYFRQSLGIALDRIDYVFPAINDKEKTMFYNTLQDDFEYFNFFVSQNFKKNPALVADVYNYTIATKALLLNASNKIKRRILTSGDQALIALYNKWKEKKNYLAQVWQMPAHEKTLNMINEASLETEVNSLEKQLSESSELFASQNDRKRYTWKDVQRNLKTGEAAVEIVRFRRHSFEFTDTVYYAAIVVKPGAANPEMHFFENGNFLETRLIKAYQNSIGGNIQDIHSYKGYWEPIAARLSGVKKVFVSPDGVYNQININSLLNPVTKKYVIEEVEVQQVTNTKDILSLPSRASVRNAIMLGFPDYKALPGSDSKNLPEESSESIADSVKREIDAIITPLPGTLSEVNLISTIFKAKNIETKIVTGLDANESFLKKIESPSILHIATHGFFMADVQTNNDNSRGSFLGINTTKANENPLLRSGILLAGAQLAARGTSTGSEDGILSAYEAMNLNLEKTQLVVLSACETGLGEVRNGEGVYGFQRALIIAGAEGVIMSLWKVSDEVTQKLMTSFYQFWMDGVPKRQAFINAQNKIRKEYPEPQYWAPFILIGD